MYDDNSLLYRELCTRVFLVTDDLPGDLEIGKQLGSDEVYEDPGAVSLVK